jgi:hypothetical protein
MVEEGFSWIYLIFFLVPLARILPRLVRKWRKGKSTFPESQFSQSNPEIENRPEPFEKPENQFSQTNPEIEKRPKSFEKPQNKEMRVLGELNKGVRDFNKIQRNLGIHNQELENILKGLEDQGLMKVVKKSGLVGTKIVLYPTDKGFKKYYS